jgi:hypothetical protein
MVGDKLRGERSGLRLGFGCRYRFCNGRRLAFESRFAADQEVEGEVVLFLLVSLTMNRGAEFLVMELANNIDLLAAMKALHTSVKSAV